MDDLPIEGDRRDATAEEIKTLPHVADSLPLIVWVALVAGGAERFTYYAYSAPWQNYMQRSRVGSGIPGALGLGEETATSISNGFYFFAALTPIPFAIVSDMWLGRYKTMVISFLLNFVGCLVLFVTSLPSVATETAKVAGLVLSLFLLGLGNGGVKTVVSPFIGDQYTVMTPQLVVRKKGKRIIVDRTLTMQYIYNVFYWFTNIGGLSGVVSATYLEKYVGFWAAYLLPLCFFFFSIPSLLFWNKSFVKMPIQGNSLPQAGRVIICSARNRFRLDAAKPAFQKEKRGREVPWDNQFVSDIRRAFKAFKVMLCVVPFYLCLSQLTNNLISQAGQMRLGIGIPNDAIPAFNAIGCVVLGPVVQHILYPTLQSYGVSFKPIARMTWSFVATSTAMAYAAGLQKMIYSTGPCYDMPRACPASNNGSIPNNITVWLQIPVYFLLALGEILGFTTLSEYSYSEAPKDMRSVVQALRQVSAGIGNALALALSQVSGNPQILWLYTSLAAVMIFWAAVFWFAFKRYDRDNGELNKCRYLETDSDNDSRESSETEKTELSV